MTANRKIIQRCLALAENERCNPDAKHGKIRFVSLMLFVPCWWIQWHPPGQDWCVKKAVLLVCRMLWQSELRAQSLEVNFGHKFIFVSCSALRLRERKGNFNKTVSISWSTGLTVAEPGQAVCSSCFTGCSGLGAAGNRSATRLPLPPPGCRGEWKETSRNWWVRIRAF